MRFFSVLALAIAIPLAAQNATVSIQRDGNGYKVAGWIAGDNEPSAGWQSIFSLYAGEGDVPPMLGTYAVENGVLIFRPKYSPSPGTHVRAVFRPAGASPIESIFDEAKVSSSASTFIEHVFPSKEELPENLLKFYIQFSAPMSRGEAWQHIHLLDENGKPVELPFLEISQELWDREQRRLTVLFDPGRIKRGVTPNEEVGMALTEGKRYTLVIDQQFADARGLPMKESSRKPIRVVAADRKPPDVKQWEIIAPAAKTTAPLIVRFPEAMDWAMMQRVFTVQGPDGPANGIVSTGMDETEWRFVPSASWQAGDYRLLVDTSFEDLAGNRIGRAFDVDLDRFDEVTERVEQKTESLSFRVTSR